MFEVYEPGKKPTKITSNGVTTTIIHAQEKYEEITTRKGVRVKHWVQYDYRDADGELFSCVRPSLKDCRIARNEWLIKKGRKST